MPNQKNLKPNFKKLNVILNKTNQFKIYNMIDTHCNLLVLLTANSLVLEVRGISDSESSEPAVYFHE